MTQAPQTMAPAASPVVDLSRRTDFPSAYDDRTMLLTFLDYVRLTVHQKCAGISQEHASARLMPTSPLTTIGGLVSHLRWVEADMIGTFFLGEDDRSPCTEEEPDAEMRIGAERPIEKMLADYAAECARNDEVIAAHSLEDLSVRKVNGAPAPLKFAIMHLIEETARHNGHIDLLREMADGVTGA